MRSLDVFLYEAMLIDIMVMHFDPSSNKPSQVDSV